MGLAVTRYDANGMASSSTMPSLSEMKNCGWLFLAVDQQAMLVNENATGIDIRRKKRGSNIRALSNCAKWLASARRAAFLRRDR
jgi:hypothetical protein